MTNSNKALIKKIIKKNIFKKEGDFQLEDAKEYNGTSIRPSNFKISSDQ